MMDLIKLMFLCCVLFMASVRSEYKPCQLREYPKGFVCVCNETYCDTADVKRPTVFGDYVVISSTPSGKRFDVGKGRFKPKIYPNVIRVERSLHENEINKETVDNTTESGIYTVTLTIDRDKKYQTIIGFGGAFTGTVSYLFDSMPTTLRHALYRNYYSKDEGIGYNLLRIPIGGCDFDFEPWAYNESPTNDAKLSNFTQLDARDLKRIEQIDELKRIANIDEIKVIGAAWSPPRWMKTNNEWSGKSSLKPEFYQTWAEYHMQYLALMDAHNMPLWAISTGNEPLNGVIGWFFIHFMSLGWIPQEQGKWIQDNLGPLLKNSKFKNIKLFAGDDQRYTFPWWFEQMNRIAPKAMDFVDGLAVHWYWDRLISPVNLDKAHLKYPEKILLNTESCIGDKPFEFHGPVLGLWSRAERYALGIIQDLQHFVAGWIDWNLILNENGGPTYINNTVDAAVILNSTNNLEFYKQPIFYVLGHFSKFILPECVRISATLTGYNANTMKTVAFECKDNTVTVVFYNHSNKKRLIEYTDDLRGTFEIEIEARSIITFVFA